MNRCDAKQKAFAQRVYIDLKICRKWSKLHAYFDETNKWIFFIGTQSDDQPLIFVLPMSCDQQFTVDELFNLKSKLSSALPATISSDIQSVLMAIVANDFTIGYFNFTTGLPTVTSLESETSTNSVVSSINNDFISEIKTENVTNEWSTTDPSIVWD
ncbi:unnamed protein product [Adineta ricciae]|uniref:tRNA-splicing endonuclease subunit Sen15 domain-containing protein n=1 Tax=Adineta ricciae TaxID=249248 RepID=A0A813YL71_ADIRI|nr:unnamed protein product [Adineta ricciae]CAF0925644.1 unnamed protein product [Adineta ricciae]